MMALVKLYNYTIIAIPVGTLPLVLHVHVVEVCVLCRPLPHALPIPSPYPVSLNSKELSVSRVTL